ncbi:hypothetical protein ANN_24811 [Periplaneta americana]|uniref:Uncharacterized protein n=1 Tax=Periplaneta americana TaxID=6978 RepID=A0ABQ8RZM4_PERAM|nr:hypothetical protein ANN_24811 [Periplaneta americana]
MSCRRTRSIQCLNAFYTVLGLSCLVLSKNDFYTVLGFFLVFSQNAFYTVLGLSCLVGERVLRSACTSSVSFVYVVPVTLLMLTTQVPKFRALVISELSYGDTQLQHFIRVLRIKKGLRQWDDDISNIIADKRQAFNKHISTKKEEDQIDYRKKRAIAKREVRKKKPRQNWINFISQEKKCHLKQHVQGAAHKAKAQQKN